MSFCKSCILIFLLTLNLITCECQRYSYYDDETWFEDEEAVVTGMDEDDDNIIYDEGIYRMLLAGGYMPLRPKYNKHLVSINTRRATMYFGDNYFCTGTLIGAQLVATAAHCFVDFENHTMRPRRLLLVLGTPNRLKHSSGTVMSGVRSIHIHPDYMRDTRHDIALLFLKDVIFYSTSTVEILSLAISRPTVGTTCTAVGWGRMLYMGPYASDAIYVDLTVLSDSECIKAYGKNYDIKGNICVGTIEGQTEASVCRGDSGCPLICGEQLAGISAYGYNCGSTNIPSVFTDVHWHTNWIYLISDGKRKMVSEWMICVLILGNFIFLN